MRSLSISLVFSLAFVLAKTDPALAQIAFDPPSIDLGEAKAGQVFAQQVKVTNQGTQPVTVTEIKSSCGCIRPVIEPSVLPPGGSGTLKLVINTLTSNPGPTTFGLKVVYREQDQPREVPYLLTCRVVQEIVVTPASITFIGERPRPQVLTILDKRSRPLRPIKIEPTSPSLVVEWVQPPAGDPQPQYALHLTIRDDLPPGLHDHEIVVHTDDPAYPALRIPIKIQKKARARYVASPFLVMLAQGVSPSRQVTIRDQQGEGLTIERLEVTQGLTAALAGQGATSATLQVALDPNQKVQTPYNGEVKVHIKGQVQPVRVLVNVD
jgi:hypothetical protein